MYHCPCPSYPKVAVFIIHGNPKDTLVISFNELIPKCSVIGNLFCIRKVFSLIRSCAKDKLLLPGLTTTFFSKFFIKLLGTFSHSIDTAEIDFSNLDSKSLFLKSPVKEFVANLFAGAFISGSHTDILYPIRNAASVKNPPI